jgi:hypothetical protein
MPNVTDTDREQRMLAWVRGMRTVQEGVEGAEPSWAQLSSVRAFKQNITGGAFEALAAGTGDSLQVPNFAPGLAGVDPRGVGRELGGGGDFDIRSPDFHDNVRGIRFAYIKPARPARRSGSSRADPAALPDRRDDRRGERTATNNRPELPRVLRQSAGRRSAARLVGGDRVADRRHGRHLRRPDRRRGRRLGSHRPSTPTTTG